MKLKVELSPDSEEEIIIRCKQRDDRVKRIENVIENLINENAEMVLTLGESEFYIPKKQILFFESDSGKTCVHTKDKIFQTKLTLLALEKVLPPYFLRASKCCIINAHQVRYITHNITGPSKIGFSASEKIAFASRSYYKYLKERIYAIRGIQG